MRRPPSPRAVWRLSPRTTAPARTRRLPTSLRRRCPAPASRSCRRWTHRPRTWRLKPGLPSPVGCILHDIAPPMTHRALFASSPCFPDLRIPTVRLLDAASWRRASAPHAASRTLRSTTGPPHASGFHPSRGLVHAPASSPVPARPADRRRRRQRLERRRATSASSAFASCTRLHARRRRRAVARRDARRPPDAVANGRRGERVSSRRRTGEDGVPAWSPRRRLGLQRARAGSHDRGQRRRPGALPRAQQAAGAVLDALARAGDADRDGRRAGISQDADRAGRRVHLRVHRPSERHVLLPLAHGDAGDDGA